MTYRNIRNRLIDSMVNRSNDSIKHLLNPIYMFSVIFFLIGFTYNAIIYMIEGASFLYLNRVVGICFVLFVLYLLKSKNIDINKAIIFNALIIASLLMSIIIQQTIIQKSNSAETILVEMSTIFIPTILSGLTIYRNKSIVISFFIIVLYAFSAVYLDDKTLKRAIVIFSFISLGIQYELFHLMNVIDKMKSKNSKLTLEQKALIGFFDLTNEQWKQIRDGKLQREQAIAIVSRLEKDLQEKLYLRVKEIIQSEEEIKEILRKYHPDLTVGEQQTCCFILQGKSVTDIAKIKEVSNSGVTIMRSRIRKKLHLGHNDSLKDYLEKIVRRHL